MNQKDNMFMRVILCCVSVTFHRISTSLKGFYKGSRLTWIFLFFTLCMPYTTPDEKQTEVSHQIMLGCWIFKQALQENQNSCPSAFLNFSILNNPDIFNLSQFYFSHFQKKRAVI